MSKAAELAKIGEVATNSQIGGRRNIIINGAMNVAQRSASVTGIGGSNGYFTVDRFHIGQDATAGRLTMTQTADGPSGFANCIKLDCTTADTSIAAGEIMWLEQRIEGQDVQQFKKGTSDAEEFTVSFYVKGNANATYALALDDVDNTRQIAKLFSVTTAWTRIIMTFPADTTGAFDDDNAQSLSVRIWLHAGSTYSSGTLQSSAWGGRTSANRAAGITSFFDSTDRTFFLTGLQLEVGSVATPFEHRSFGEELALCQRYYCEKSNVGGPFRAAGYGGGGTTGGFVYDFPVAMRAAPTGTLTIGEAISANNGAAATTVSGLASAASNPHGSNPTLNGVGSYTGKGLSFYSDAAGDKTVFAFDAEL